MTTETIEVVRGNTKNIPVAVTQDGSSFALTGYTCRLVVKKSETSTSYSLDMTAEAGDISGNVVTFALDAADTNLPAGDYLYTVNISKADPAFDRDVAKGVFIVLPSLITD